MELLVRIGCAAGDDLRLARWRRMLHAHIQAAPADRIAQPGFLVDIRTTKGILFASTVPNSGIEDCQAEKISSSIAYNPSVNRRVLNGGVVMFSTE